MAEDLTAPERRQARRAIAAATIGNALEFYDFMIFSFFAIQIGAAFFPSADPVASLMASLAAFGAGFVTRPLGAWIIGGYADRHGRKPALVFSMVLMGLAIGVIALTPSYTVIGMAAPVIVVLARLAQGFAVGGEVGPATAYLLENASEDQRGVVVGMQRVSQLLAVTAGSLVGLLLSLLLPADAFAEYGWRIAMLLGVFIVPFALWMRRRLPETHGPADDQEAAMSPADSAVRRIYVIGPVLMAAGTICAYVGTYLATFGQASLNLSSSTALAGQLAGNAAALVTCLASGWISDRVGRKPALLAIIAAQILLIPLSFAWMVGERALASFLIGSVLLSAAIGAFPSPANTAIIESLPKARRSRGFALIFSIPVSLFGASTQLIVTWLIAVTGSQMMVAWFPVAGLVLALLATLMLRESAPGRLSRG